jgi:hypothetical protein
LLLSRAVLSSFLVMFVRYVCSFARSFVRSSVRSSVRPFVSCVFLLLLRPRLSIFPRLAIRLAPAACFECRLCGFPPFYDDNNAALFAQIKSGSFDFPSPYWDHVTDEGASTVSLRRGSLPPRLWCRWIVVDAPPLPSRIDVGLVCVRAVDVCVCFCS